MKRNHAVFLFCLIAHNASAQPKDLYHLSKDNARYELTVSGASLLAGLPMKCIDLEFPNKTNHTSLSDSDHVLLPKQLHPAFYGCFDWHSCVHGHWMLVRLMKTFPDLPETEKIHRMINGTITTETILGETKYFDLPLTSSWERTYGWAWLLKLDAELKDWNDPDGRRWYRALQPLVKKVVSIWKTYLPKQNYANRSGLHPNTAFGLVLALDYARAEKDVNFETSIVAAAKMLFAKDVAAPANWEPNGTDFLSPSLEEADLMLRILDRRTFVSWFDHFLSLPSVRHLSVLPVVTDRSDLQIVHLDGLCFSRAWCMQHIASALADTDPRRKVLQEAAKRHLADALPHVVSGEYGGEHWLATFAVYALLDK